VRVCRFRRSFPPSLPETQQKSNRAWENLGKISARFTHGRLRFVQLQFKSIEKN
jgi:hypothetical protein